MSRAPGSPRTGGRIRGKKSISLAERRTLTDRMAGDLMAVYEKLGGVNWLLKYAEDNPKEFVAQGLSRLFPAAQRDDPELLLQQFNSYNQINGISDFEAGRRIAFALSKAMASQEISPQEACSLQPLERPEPRWVDPATLPPAASIGDEELSDLCKAQEAERLVNLQHRGSAAERGLARPTPTVEKQQRVPVRLRRHPLI